MADTPSVSLTRQELHDRLSQIHNGDSPDRVTTVLGVRHYERKNEGSGRTRLYWLIDVVDGGPAEGGKQIYMGEFENDRLAFGHILPTG